jgi:hypothetical protein
MTAVWLRLVLTRELAAFAEELALFPEEHQIWSTLPGVFNSAGNLALHVCGNLQHFVGATLGSTGYVRDRPLEFSARGLPRATVIAEIERTMQVVNLVLPKLTGEALAAEYPDVLGGLRVPTGLFLLHLSSHLVFHVGQAGYLRRIITGESRSSSAIAMSALSQVPLGSAMIQALPYSSIPGHEHTRFRSP